MVSVQLARAMCVVALICVAPTRPRTPAGFGAQLLFSSGFEQDTYLEPACPTAYNEWRNFHGVDRATGFSWDRPPFSAPGNFAGMLQVLSNTGTPAPGSATDYIRNTIEVVAGHDGRLTRTLRMYIVKASPNTNVTQNNLEIAQISEPVRSVYLSYWIRLNPEILDQLRAGGKEYWREFTGFKTASDYRLVTYVSNPNGAGVPNWHAHADDGGLSHSGPVKWYWQMNDRSVPLPVDQWSFMEFYIYRSADDAGRFLWAVNGLTLGDYRGSTMGANNEEISMLAISALYGPNPTNWYQWLDDIEVWDLPPCGTLPCGPERTLQPRYLRAPARPPSGPVRR